MMGDRPDARGLIDAARHALRERLIGHLPETTRLEALKILRALDIAARELDTPHDHGIDHAALASAIRAGHHDGDMALHARLLDEARARLAIANPRSLRP
jgi:hypothetical protein